MKRWLTGFAFLIFLCLPAKAGEIHGRVIDRGTLKPDGSAKGISGVQISVYDGKRVIATTATNGKGGYRIRKITVAHCRITYRVKGHNPASVSRDYATSDTSSRDVYLDASRPYDGTLMAKDKDKEEKGKDKGKNRGQDKGHDKSPTVKSGGYYEGMARGILAMAKNPAFFGEDAEDSVPRLSSYFDPRDTSADFQDVICELLWAEFLSEDRPLETRYYLASALAPLLDSVGWGKVHGMARYLEVPPEVVYETGKELHAALRDPKKLPNPKEIRKLGMSVSLASQMANEYLSDPGLSERVKDRFLVKWKKAWGKDAPTFKEDADEGAFSPAAVMTKLVAAKEDNAEVHYLRGRGLFAVRDYAAAASELGTANRLAGGHSAARHMEAMAYLRLGRDQEALGRFQALRESPDPYWKAQAFRGLALIEEKEQRHQEAAADLWKAERLVPDPDNEILLAEVSLKFTERGEIEKVLEALVAKTGDHRAHYWLGRYADENQQSGVAEDHYRKAWAAATLAEYAEALSRIYMSRDEYGTALGLLESVRTHLTPDGRQAYAECMLQAGRAQEAAKEYALVYAAHATPEILSRYVEALIQNNRAPEALKVANAFPDQTQPAVRFALAKASVHNHDAARARPILEELVKREETNPENHYLLGLTYYEDNNWSKAKDEFDEAIRYRQDYLEATYYCGLTSVKLGKADGARNLFNELAQRTSLEWRAKGFLGVGLAFAAQQKPEAAENFYQRSLDVQETAEAEALLALSRRRLGGPEKWVGLAKKAYALDPTHPKAISAFGESMIVQGKKAQALILFKKALETNPNSCDLLSGLAQSQFLTGAYKDSRGTSGNAMSACPQEPSGYYVAAETADKLQNHKEAEGFYKGFRKAGGDETLVPEDYR